MASEKRGRPRHDGARYPSGRLRPAEYRSDTQIRRIVEQGLALGLDPMLASQAGRLRLQGHINDRHLAVIDHVGRIYGRYEFYAGLRRRTQSPGYEASKQQAGSSPIATRRRRPRRAPISSRCSRLIPDFPAEARAVIERLCVDDLHVPQHFLPDLIVLLERIDAALWAAGARRRRSRASGCRCAGAPGAVMTRPASLAEENDYLRAQVHQLKDALGSGLRWPAEWNLSPRETRDARRARLARPRDTRRDHVRALRR